MRWIAQNSLCVGVLAGILVACSENSSVPVVPDRFVAAYTEIRIASKEYGETSPEARIARRDVFRKYGFTLASFDSTAKHIEQTPDLWAPFQQAVTARLDSMAKSLGVAPAPAHQHKNNLLRPVLGMQGELDDKRGAERGHE